MNTDTAPVRPHEELDLDALGEYLRRHLEPATADGTRVKLEQFPGGHSNLTYLIRFGDHELVLRRPPIGPLAPTAHNMPREYKLLSAIHPVFPLAPAPILLCEDNEVIGAPFYLMERRRGLIVRHKIPGEIGADPAKRRQVSEAVVDTLVDLHSVDIFSTGVSPIGKPEGFVARQVHGWSERWQRSKTSEVPEMDKVAHWLANNLPADGTLPGSTLVHNDYKLDNVMLDAADPGRVVAVLDWEMCTVGDPLVDLGLFLCYWTLKDESESAGSSLSAVTHGPGWLTREEIVDRYQSKTGRDLSRIGFYETFALFKVAVILQQIFFRFVRGQTKDPRFSNFDVRVAGLARAAQQKSAQSDR